MLLALVVQGGRSVYRYILYDLGAKVLVRVFINGMII